MAHTPTCSSPVWGAVLLLHSQRDGNKRETEEENSVRSETKKNRKETQTTASAVVKVTLFFMGATVLRSDFKTKKKERKEEKERKRKKSRQGKNKAKTRQTLLLSYFILFFSFFSNLEIS